MYAPTGQTPGYDFITELEESEQTFDFLKDEEKKEHPQIEKPISKLDGAGDKVADAFAEIGYSTINAVQSAADFAISRKISAKKMNKL